MTQTPSDGPAPLSPGDGSVDERSSGRDAALAMVPRLLVALAGACALSGAIGTASLFLGYGAPHLLVLLAPPAVVLFVAPGVLLRARRMEER